MHLRQRGAPWERGAPWGRSAPTGWSAPALIQTCPGYKCTLRDLFAPMPIDPWYQTYPWANPWNSMWARSMFPRCAPTNSYERGADPFLVVHLFLIGPVSGPAECAMNIIWIPRPFFVCFWPTFLIYYFLSFFQARFASTNQSKYHHPSRIHCAVRYFSITAIIGSTRKPGCRHYYHTAWHSSVLSRCFSS